MKQRIPLRLNGVCPQRCCSRVPSYLSATRPTSPCPSAPSPSDLSLMPNLALLTPKLLIPPPLPLFHDGLNPIRNP